MDIDRAGRRGIVLAEWTDRASASGRLSLHLTGLNRDDRVQLVLSSAPCGTPMTSASRLLAVWLPVGAKGRIWRDRMAVTLTKGTFGDVRTVRLMEDEGIFFGCRTATVWDDTDIAHVVNGAFAILNEGTRKGIVVIGPADEDGARVAWSLSIGPDTTDRLVGTSTGCAAGIGVASRLFSLPVTPTSPGVSFRSGRTETLDKDETIAIHGLHLRPAGGPAWTCERAVLVALLLP